MNTISTYQTTPEVIRGLADYFVEVTSLAIAARGRCTVVLSGGNSPKLLYELLAREYQSKLDWKKITFFFADERHVPFDHPDNTGAMVKKILFDPLKILDSQIFYINTTLKPEGAAKEYAKKIPDNFDLVLLGLGEDAHTASLMPHTLILKEDKAAVRAVYAKDKQAYRITMTAPLINKSYAIAFLAYGKNKERAVSAVIQGQNDPDTYPAQLIKSEKGVVRWFLDREAAGGLSEPNLTE